MQENKREGVAAQLVSGNYFTGLGVRPILGRVFSPAEDAAPGRDPVAVISWECWQSRFSGDTNVIGRPLHVANQDLVIIGVAPAGFRGLYPFVAPEFWVPTAMEQALGAHTVYQMVGRLAPGVSRQRAVAEVDAITQRLSATYTHSPAGYERYGLIGTQRRTTLLHAALGSWGPQRGGREQVEALASLLMGAVGLVLLIACANAANLLLVRAFQRRK